MYSHYVYCLFWLPEGFRLTVKCRMQLLSTVHTVFTGSGWVACNFLAINLVTYIKSESNCWWEKVSYLDRNVKFLL